MNATPSLAQELLELKEQHRTLDMEIEALSDKLSTNQLELGRLKRQKLVLKDSINRMESKLIPDLHA